MFRIPSRLYMHAADIKALLAKRGFTQARICAEGLTASRSAVSRVIHGSFKSQRIARHIAGLLGLPVSALWPGQYPALESEQPRRRRAVVNNRRAA
jgi:lambda repressor-like predicted transcriptional regulator